MYVERERHVEEIGSFSVSPCEWRDVKWIGDLSIYRCGKDVGSSSVCRCRAERECQPIYGCRIDSVSDSVCSSRVAREYPSLYRRRSDRKPLSLSIVIYSEWQNR